MSKEATGENGAILGSSEYWDRVNRAAFFGRLMRNASDTNYQETLREVGHRAGSAVEEICDDLQNNIKSVRAISSGCRSSLAKRVQGLYDVCSMAGGFCSHSSDCIGILNLSSFYLPSTSFGDDRAIQNAIHKIKNCPDFFASECIDLIRQAADWSISFAAGSDARKSAFLKDVSQGKDREFLRDVLNAYHSSNDTTDLRGNCGYSIGSREYRDYMERKVFLQDLPAMSGDDYDGALRDALTSIANQLQRDLAKNERENNYITDETARKLRDAVSELGHCGISVGFADSAIERLDWFVGGDPDKIRRLQNKLNELGIGQRLEEDGVFGVKTLAAWNKFKEVLTGSVPQLGFIDPLQPEHTGYSHRIVAHRNLPKGNEYSIILDKNNSPKGTRAFMLDKPHDVDGKPVGYHMNVEFDVPEKFQKFFYNHKEISESTYLKLKNFKNVAKPVRIAGRVLLAMGSALDVIELGTTIYEDVKDANNFPEKGTVSTAVEIGGRWTGSVLGAQKGAAVGAVIGSAFPVVGTAVGGAVGGVLGGIGGSYLGGWIGECVVDITWLYE